MVLDSENVLNMRPEADRLRAGARTPKLATTGPSAQSPDVGPLPESAPGGADDQAAREGLRQILYVSLSTIPGDKADLVGILHQSRNNNALDGVTGLLWSDGRCFLQVLEGPAASVTETFARIAADPRHHSLQVLLDGPVAKREFGSWTMAHRRESDSRDAYDARIHRLLSNASDGVRAQFLSLIASGEVLPVSRAPD